MTDRTPFEKAEVELAASLDEPGRQRPAPEPDSPFRILLVGNFGGRGAAAATPIAVDRDNLEEVMDELDVELSLRPAGDDSPEITLRPREIDDFHPDHLFGQTAAFSGLRRLREELEDPDTFAAAAAQVRAWSPQSPSPTGQARHEAGGEDLVAEMLESAARRDDAAAHTDGFDALVRHVVEPHLAPRDDPAKADLVATVDAAIQSWMRNLLHHPGFQALESAWRGVDFLVRRLEADGQLQVFLLDLSKDALAKDLRSASDLSESAAARLLVGETDEEGWSALVGLYSFEPTIEDVALLGRMGKIARAAGAPFVSAASPRIAGCASLAETPDAGDWRPTDQDAALWSALRQLPEAAYLGLALPRFLLRLPYGRETDAIEQFPFEELDEAARHEDYLWGSPAVACACLLGQLFTEYGWHMRPQAGRDLPSLPLHTHHRDGRARNQPCAEALLSDRAAEILLDAGLMPLLSMKDRDVARLLRFQSIADPPTQLAGPWR
jgi:type VI secretion system protein ImpC